MVQWFILLRITQQPDLRIKDNMVSIQHKKTRTYGLYRMGLYETYRIVILGDDTYVFHILEGKAYVGTTEWDQ